MEDVPFCSVGAVSGFPLAEDGVAGWVLLWTMMTSSFIKVRWLIGFAGWNGGRQP
jgi:hypothetical protein